MAEASKLLFLQIPEVPEGASFEFHPISKSQRPLRYRPEQLKGTGEAQTPWLAFFEEIMLGIFWRCEAPVPFVFRTADGVVRSLDAGCLKWLQNRRPPEVEFRLNEHRQIETIVPSPGLQARYEERRSELIARLSKRK